MDTKPTLTLDKEKIERAKKIRISFFVKNLSIKASILIDLDVKETYYKHLEKKYR